jgi:hypothetical protein
LIRNLHSRLPLNPKFHAISIINRIF